MKNFFLLTLVCYLACICAFQGSCKNNNYSFNEDVVTLQEGTYNIADLHL